MKGWVDEELERLNRELAQAKQDYGDLRAEVGEAEARAYGRLTDLAAQVDTLRKRLYQVQTAAIAPDVDPEVLREALAQYAHDAWSGWMQYLFSKGHFKQQPEAGSLNGQETVWIMPAWAVERWTRQMHTSYADLPEEEKVSDREEADKMLEIIMQTMAQRVERLEDETSNLGINPV